MPKTQLPEVFLITPAMRDWAEEEVPLVNIEIEHRKFCDHWLGNGKKMANWTATWRNWMRRAPQFKGAMRSQDEVRIISLMRGFEAEGFRRAYRHETSMMYEQAFLAWKARKEPAPRRETASVISMLAKQKAIA